MDRSRPVFSGWKPEEVPPSPETPLGEPESGRYEAEGQVGRGGMGVVERAHDKRLGRVVAVKRPVDAAAAPALVREARLAAQIEHPGIVAVHDAGVGADGLPWVAMRLVRGRSLAEALAAEPADRLRWVRPFLAACEAVAHAHRLGVVHRDLKPANLLVGELGDTQVSDWGLARPLPGFGWERILGDLPPAGAAGTPGWVSPQQADGAAPDPRDDVYSLGAVLRDILGDQGPKELVAIGTKARSASREDRYATAAELAEDVSRWLDGRRVEAYAYSPREVAIRFAKAWRAPLTVAAVAAVMLTVGVGRSWLETRAALALADERLGAALLAQARHAESRGATPEAEVLAAEAMGLGRAVEARGVLAAVAAAPHPSLVSTVRLPEGCSPRPAAADGWLCLFPDAVSRHEADGQERWRVALGARDAAFAGGAVAVITHDDAIVEVRWLDDADGHALGAPSELPQPRGLVGSGAAALQVHGQTVHLLWAGTPAKAGTEAGPTVGGVGPASVLAHPVGPASVPAERCAGDRTVLAAALSDRLYAFCSDGTLEVSDGPDGDVISAPTDLRRSLAAPYAALALPGGDVLVGTAKGELARIGPDGATRWTSAPLGGPVLGLCSDAEGAVAGAWADRGGPVAFDTVSGRLRARLPDEDRGPCAFSGGDLLTHGAAARRWRLDDRPAARFDHGEGLTWVGLDGDDVLATAGDGDAVRWGPDGAVKHRFHWQERVIKAGAVLPDGTWVASGLGEPGLRVLGADGVLGLPIDPRQRPWRRLGGLASGWVWGSSYAPGVDLVRPADGAASTLAGLDDLEVFEGWTTADGRWAALVDTQGGLWRVDGGDPPRAERIGETDAAHAVAISPDGALLALTTREELHLRNVAARTERVLFTPVSTDAAISPDGRWLAIGGLDGAVRVYTLPAGDLHAELRGHDERIAAVTFSKDGAWVVSAGWDGVVRRWAVEVLDDSPEEARAGASTWGLTPEEALAAASR